MKPRHTLAFAAALAAAVPVFAQQGYDDKDAKKAEALASQDGDFKSLTDAEKQKVVEEIALQIHGRRRKATQAMIVTRKGTSVEELEKKAKSMSSYTLVSAEQDKEASSTPPKTALVTHELSSPPFGKLFADNDWEIQPGSADAETLQRQTQAVIEMIKKTGGRVVSVHVESSASTLQNTGKAAKLPHLELSRRRAESAADFVTKSLASQGIALEDDQVTLDYTGANGNGTSGASSPFACADPKLCATGSCDAPPDLVAAVKKGGLTPEERKRMSDVYDPNKFVQVSFVVVNETVSETPGASTPGEAHAVLVHVGYKEKGPGFRWPRISIRLPSIHLGGSHRGSTACPKW
jgi:hypothetical protein